MESCFPADESSHHGIRDKMLWWLDAMADWTSADGKIAVPPPVTGAAAFTCSQRSPRASITTAGDVRMRS